MSTFALSSRSVAVDLVSGLRALAMAVLVALVLVLVGGAGSAHAAKGIVGVVGVFTEQSGSGEGEFASPAGVAVNQVSGDIYVVDAGNDRVQRFDGDGNFISQFGVCGSAGGEFGWGCFGAETIAGIAVGLDGSVYVADNGNQRIQQFAADGTFLRAWGWDVVGSGPGDDTTDPVGEFEICVAADGDTCQAGVGGGEPGQFNNPVSVAVDPNDGDVLVADRDNTRIQRFDSTGHFESQFLTEGSIFPHRVAVDGSGSIYVLEPFSQVQRYDSTGTFVEVLGSGYETNPIAGPEELTAVGDRVFVGQLSQTIPQRPIVLEFNPNLAPADQLVDTHRIESGTSTGILGLAYHADSGRVYVNIRAETAAGNPYARIFILDDEGIPPATVTLLPAVAQARTATLSAEINSNGGLPTDYRFEVSPDGINWTTVDSGSVPGGNTDNLVTAEATDLRPNTLYRFRIITNKGFNSPDVTSPESTFLTDPAPPDILETRATSVDARSATLQGRINPNSSQTSYRFDYGINAFNRSIPIPNAQIGSGPNPVFVSQALRGLRPNTTYQFRLVATNPHGTTTSPTKTFTTAPAPSDGRAYELVSPPDKVAGVGVGNWYAGPAAAGVVGYPAHERERFAVRGDAGATITNGAYSFASDWTFAERGPSGWISRPAISRRAHGPQLYTFALLGAGNEDFSLTSWFSNTNMLRLFPEMESWDDTITMAKPLRQWTDDRWEIFDHIDPSRRVSTVGAPQLANGPTAIATDGSAIAASGAGVRGLAGAGDPTGRDPSTQIPWPDLEAGQSIYLDEITGPFSDTFPGDDGVRELVNVCTGTGPDRTLLPGGPCSAPGPGRSTRLISPGGASLSPTVFANVSAVRGHVMSANGSRVFFMSPDPGANGVGGPPQMYVRQRNSKNCVPAPDNDCVVTRWISQSAVDGQSASLLAPALFEGASRDGDKIFFRTATPLTEDDPNGACGAPCTTGSPDPDSADLYMYDLPVGNDPSGGQLTRISGGPDGTGDCNSPEANVGTDMRNVGALRFVSDDGSRAYFTCAAPLPGVPASANGTTTSPNGGVTSDDASNLYVYDANRPQVERWRFVARLPRGIGLRECATTAQGVGSPLVAKADATAVIVNNTANCMSGTSNGSFVTFFTDGRLTADDPDVDSGDIYGYSYTRDELSRLSAPQGVSADPYPCAPPSDAVQCFGDPGIGSANATPLGRLGVAMRPNGDPVAFFESRSRLVDEDTDDAYDVYKWRDGELTLISTGTSDTDGAMFVGNDRSGLNVFFATRDQLTWQDKDRVLDVYTARIGGGIAEPPPPHDCAALAGGCHGGGPAPTPPAQVGSGSPGESNVAPGLRKRLSLGRLSAAQRRVAARTGTLVVRVRASREGKVSLSARARIAGRTRVVARTSKKFTKPGVVTVRLRLAPAARKVLARGGRLRLTVQARSAKAEPQSLAVILRRPGR